MKRILLTLAFLSGLLLLPQLSTSAYACSCVGPITISNSFDRSTAVFSGQVVAGDRFTARVRVDKVWKGEERAEIVMLTGAQDMGNGSVMMSSCDYNYSVGQSYVIYAVNSGTQLIVPGCTRTAVKTDAEVKELDAVTPHKQIGDEVRACSSNGMRLAVQTSQFTPIAAVRTSVQGSESLDALTDRDGRADLSGLKPGQYKVTVFSDGYLAKQSFITIPASGCTDVVLHLVQAQKK